MGQQEFIYSGTEELSVIDSMHNYNNHIIKCIRQAHGDLGKVIDFGAGIGTLAKRMKPFVKSLTCVELDSRQHKLLQELGFEAVKNLDAVADASQTFIYSSNVLEHIEDDYTAVKDLGRKLQPGGKVFFYVPAFSCLYTAMDQRVGHFRRYNKKRLRDILEKADFKVEKMYYVDSVGFFVTLLFKYIGNKEGKVNERQLSIYDKFVFPLSQKLDRFSQCIVGKNLAVIATK